MILFPPAPPSAHFDLHEPPLSHLQHIAALNVLLQFFHPDTVFLYTALGNQPPKLGAALHNPRIYQRPDTVEQCSALQNRLQDFRLGEPLPVQEPVQGEKKPSASSAAESRSPSSASSSSSAPERQPVDSGNPSSREAESSPSEVERRALDSGSYPPFQEPQRLERP